MPSWRTCNALPLLLCAVAQAQVPSPVPAGGQPVTAETIMQRVAQNQDRTQAERTHFVYLQHSHVQSRKGSNLMCDEVAEARITPTPTGYQRTLLTLSGHVRDGKRVVHYTALPTGSAPQQQTSRDEEGESVTVNAGDKETVLDADAHDAPVKVNDTDLDIVESMRRTFTSNKSSKDGVNTGLFPLTTEQQNGMSFELKGRETKNGHDTFHIVFRPKDKSDYGWKGDAWIDSTAFEPVVVRTALSRSLPFAVRALLGTNVPGLGFTVLYAPQADDVWFPESFGTEFKMRILFMFSRQVIVGVQNRAFERTHVTSTLHAGQSGTEQPSAPQAPPKF